ncbi:MAG TPA: ATP cone domain-containing protein [Candidatus Didemnitutus sp.]|nr:ATP cone domain-containing protein [Candidatus Didemnitutus sp.]
MSPTLATPRFTPRSNLTPIPLSARCVIKRDGRLVPWDRAKIARAVALAFHDVHHAGAPNPHRDNPSARYGVDAVTFRKAVRIAARVAHMLELFYRTGRNPTIEQIQDNVEKAIAAEGEWEVARAYIVYRSAQASHRLNHYEENGLADYIAIAKYARYRSDLGRRELFSESVARVHQMHRRFFVEDLAQPLDTQATVALEDVARLKNWQEQFTLGTALDRAFAAVADRRVLPSMRSLQFGGEAILRNQARLFNCAFSPVDRVEFFREYLFLLLAGTGCGFSVQRHHTDRLPPLPSRGEEMELPVVHHTVGDTIEGWADALHQLLRSYWDGFKIEFNFSGVRPRGSTLRTSGGKAPGHLPLKQSLVEIETVLAGASGRRLRPIELYDICMFAARSVLSGGIRRSATICLFSPDDEEMMTAKTGAWFQKHPQRSASNNSAVLPRSEQDDAIFRRLFSAQKEFGEPGFYFADHPDYGCNPCCEIGLHPVVQGPLSETETAKLRAAGYTGPLDADTRLSGWQMCNLSTINGAILKSADDFLESCINAAVIGTIQAAYTDTPYLGPVTRYLNERDALLGISICGFMDNPDLLFDPELLERGARLSRAVNKIIAAAIGIRPAARVTCVKPEGTASLLLGAASGIHPHHARHYFRRVQANRRDPVYRHFAAANPHLTEPSVYRRETDDVITFAVEAPPHAVLRHEIGAVEFLRCVQLVQRHWVLAGEAEDSRSPGLHHNVSNTCTVNPDEWDSVADFIWRNRENFTGISLLAHDGDKRYAQAPREAVATEDDIARWNRLKYQPVDYTALAEHTDETALKDVVACAGGACELT